MDLENNLHTSTLFKFIYLFNFVSKLVVFDSGENLK